MASARMQRWAVHLAAFDYSIQYIKGPDNYFADMLSRAPNENFPEKCDNKVSFVNFIISENVLNADMLRDAGNSDKEINKLKKDGKAKLNEI